MRFDQVYNQEHFLKFLGDFLPDDFVEKEEDIVIKDRYKEITKAKLLGFCESLNVHVLEMEHGRENDPRIAIATDAFKILADHWIHKALVIFKSNNSDNYRFSYLTISLDVNERNKVVRKYSNARRYSFYLGPNAKVRTPEQQLIKKGNVKDAGDLLSRFSVEVVNKQFYLEVAKYFDELVSNEDSNLALPSVSQENINIRKSFAVRLIGRLMFCWFLKQKKSDFGQLIPDELLASGVVLENYYHNILEPLFFEVLNTSIDTRGIRNKLFDKVPYLNGGLFNPQYDDYYDLDRGTFTSKHINTLRISDTWFRDFFGLLETYNFTIDENTVFDQELSVDPEMLGRIFENLLAEINPETGSSERKRTGSFYTPRQIVEYMVDQSLIEYLKTKTSLDEKKLSSLVSYDLTDDAEHPLGDNEKQSIINAIESLKLLDPACGSGAYPIGALQKIVYILQQVDPDCRLWLKQKLKDVPELYKQKIINEVRSNPFDYTRKLDVIKNSIFGVDIQPIAVDVSRLRCFLTLVVESEIDDTKPNRGIEPLPNLDFKFVCANTLIGLPKSQSNNLFEDHSGITELSRIMSEYFSCNSQRKNEIRLKFSNTQKDILNRTLSAFGKNVGELTQKLTLWDPFSNKSNSWFDPEWMFGLEDGFDIVIANPPYVSINKLARSKDPLISHLKSGQASLGNFYGVNLHSIPNYAKKYPPKPNLFAFFFVTSSVLAKSGGTINFIVPKGVLTAKDLDVVRYFFIDKLKVNQILVFKEKVFVHGDTSAGTIATSSLVVLLQKGENHEDYEVDIANIDLTDINSFKFNRVSSQLLRENLNNWNIILFNERLNGLILKYKKHSGANVYFEHTNPDKPSKDHFYFDVGFSLDDKYKLIETKPTDSNSYYRLFDSSGFKKYLLETNGYYPKDHSKIQLTKNSQGYIVLDQKYKIVWSVKNPKNFSFSDEEIIFPMGKAAIIASNDKEEILYLLGLLNSVLSWFIFRTYFKNEGEKDFLLPISAIKSFFRVPKITNNDTKKQKKRIIEIISEILVITKSEKRMTNQDNQAKIKEYEGQIDQIVYKLYDLTPEEIKIVEEVK